MLNLSSGKNTAKRNSAPATPAASPRHLVINSRDMPIIRTSGDLSKWRELSQKIKPVTQEKSGGQILKSIRAARESRRS